MRTNSMIVDKHYTRTRVGLIAMLDGVFKEGLVSWPRFTAKKLK